MKYKQKKRYLKILTLIPFLFLGLFYYEDLGILAFLFILPFWGLWYLKEKYFPIPLDREWMFRTDMEEDDELNPSITNKKRDVDTDLKLNPSLIRKSK